MAKERIFNEYKISGKVTEIYVTQRDDSKHIILIDTKNLNKLIDFGHSWHVQWHDDTQSYYAHTTIYNGSIDGKPDYTNITMQTFLFSSENEEMLDHINHNTLDNRKSNIRKIKRSNNLKHRKGKNSNNTSGYRNVSLINDWYRIQLQIKGKNYLFSEKFEDVDDAGRFAQEMRLKYYGEFAGNN